MTGLWKTWMRVWCWATAAVGAILALGAFPATDFAARIYYDVAYWPIDGVGLTDDARFTAGVLGAVMIGWAVTIFALIGAAERAGASAWRGLTTAMLVWFAVDSTISVASGVPMNAVANAGFLVTYLIPVIASGVLRQATPPLQPRAA